MLDKIRGWAHVETEYHRASVQSPKKAAWLGSTKSDLKPDIYIFHSIHAMFYEVANESYKTLLAVLPMRSVEQ